MHKYEAQKRMLAPMKQAAYSFHESSVMKTEPDFRESGHASIVF